MVNEDGQENVNDMFHENRLLQSENQTLRTRLKAMQDTINTMTMRNTDLQVDFDLFDMIELIITGNLDLHLSTLILLTRTVQLTRTGLFIAVSDIHRRRFQWSNWFS